MVYFVRENKHVSYKSVLCDVTEMPLIAAVKMSSISDKRKHEHSQTHRRSFTDFYFRILILDLRHI